MSSNSKFENFIKQKSKMVLSKSGISSRVYDIQKNNKRLSLPNMKKEVFTKKQLDYYKKPTENEVFKTQIGFKIRQNIRNKLKDDNLFNKFSSSINAKSPKTKGIKGEEDYFSLLLKNFLSKLKCSFTDLYEEFYSYFRLYIKESKAFQKSETKQFLIFKTTLKKIEEKIVPSDNDVESNNDLLFLFENLFKDFTKLVSKNICAGCCSFLSNFILTYKGIVLSNYEIYSNRLKEKENIIQNLNTTISSLKKSILDKDNEIFEADNKIKSLEEKNFDNDMIIRNQKNDIESLQKENEELENKIKIKDYENKNLMVKMEDYKKYGSNGLDKGDEFRERLNIETLLKNRVERLKFNKFKNDVKKK